MNRKAVIDLGTNTCNLLIADPLPGGLFRVLYDRKLPVKLGRGGINKKILCLKQSNAELLLLKITC